MSFKDLYLGYNPNRVYTRGDKVIAYNSCATKLNLWVCVQTGATGNFVENSWAKIAEETTQFDLCRGYKATDLGRCSQNITLREPKVNNIVYQEVYKINNIPTEIWFDNRTFV